MVFKVCVEKGLPKVSIEAEKNFRNRLFFFHNGEIKGNNTSR
jgi:hypothetical protein